MESGRVGEAGGERKRKKTLGRQKIEIKKISCQEARHVCFSKRRFGLFKKATELCALTGAHLAIVVFSPAPAGKPYSFGHTSVDAVIEGYLNPGSYAPPAGKPANPLVLYDYEIERERLQNAIEAEGRRRTALDAAARAAGGWTDDDLRGAGMPSLVARLAALERLQAELAERQHDILTEEAMMMQQCSAMGSTNDAFQFQYPDDGTFAAGGGAGGSSSQDQEAMDMQMMLMGGNVSHALPFAPMTLLADLPPPLPVPQPFNYGSDDNHFAGCAGYGYDLGDGSSNGAAYEMGGYYPNRATTTWDFFG